VEAVPVPAPAADMAAVAPAVPKADFAGLEKHIQAELHHLVYPGEGPSLPWPKRPSSAPSTMRSWRPSRCPGTCPRYVTLWWT
jgi:hypothetical protein